MELQRGYNVLAYKRAMRNEPPLNYPSAPRTRLAPPHNSPASDNMLMPPPPPPPPPPQNYRTNETPPTIPREVELQRGHDLQRFNRAMRTDPPNVLRDSLVFGTHPNGAQFPRTRLAPPRHGDWSARDPIFLGDAHMQSLPSSPTSDTNMQSPHSSPAGSMRSIRQSPQKQILMDSPVRRIEHMQSPYSSPSVNMSSARQSRASSMTMDSPVRVSGYVQSPYSSPSVAMRSARQSPARPMSMDSPAREIGYSEPLALTYAPASNASPSPSRNNEVNMIGSPIASTSRGFNIETSAAGRSAVVRGRAQKPKNVKWNTAKGKYPYLRKPTKKNAASSQPSTVRGSEQPASPPKSPKRIPNKAKWLPLNKEGTPQALPKNRKRELEEEEGGLFRLDRKTRSSAPKKPKKINGYEFGNAVDKALLDSAAWAKEMRKLENKKKKKKNNKKKKDGE